MSPDGAAPPSNLIAGTGSGDWQRTEPGYDYFMWMASTDDEEHNGFKSSGYGDGWVDDTFDLCDVPVLGNLCGEPQVWVAFIMDSDSSVSEEGVFIDEVLIRKKAGAFGNSGQAAGPMATPFAGSLDLLPASASRP